MIIRSQDKRTITNFRQATDVSITKNDGIFQVKVYYPFSVGHDYSKLCIGTYSTEEKAIKVLDMICKAYKDFCDYSNIKNNRLFEMPQDSEV